MLRSRHPSRFALLAVAVAVAGAALAQPAPPPPAMPPPPPGLQPVPEVSGDAELEPQVTITRRETETVEEARVNGRLMWVKVTPRHGRPYFLVPDGTDFGFIRRDTFDTGLKVPLWVLLTF
jgi:Protein of unknown function (DUF2782)